MQSRYVSYALKTSRKSASDACKSSSKRVIWKTTEATGDLIGNKIAKNITRV